MLQKIDMNYSSTWNLWNLHRTGSVTTAAKELAKYNSDLVGVHEVRWTEVALKQQLIIHFSLEMGIRIMNQEQDFSHIRESRGLSLLLIGCHI
jgi:hypothetical protein